MPVIIAGNKAQKDKYLTRMIEEPLMCVSKACCQLRKILDIDHVGLIDILYMYYNTINIKY